MRRLSPRPSPGHAPARRQQAGVALIEFALVALIFFMILLGVMEFGRWLFTLNAAAEATRWGARLAAVCGSTPAQIKSHVGIMLRSGNGTFRVIYPATCDTIDCLVTVELVGATFTPLIPYFGEPIELPKFTTSVPRESLGPVIESGAPVLPDVCPTSSS